jgi:arylsulfatase A-like enzyme
MPNVVLISLDTMRHDGIRAVADMAWWEKWRLADAVHTPNLDRFAGECQVFRRCYGTSSFTPPSHASMVTGRYVPAHGVKAFFYSMRPGLPTVAQVLRDEGYVTAAWFENECLDYCGILRDFDETYNYQANTWDEFAKRLADLEATFPGKVFAFIHLFDLHSPYMMSLRTVGREGAVDEYFAHLDRVLRELGYPVPKWFVRGVSRLMEKRPRNPAEMTHYGERVCCNGEVLAEWVMGEAGDLDFRARAYTRGLSYFDEGLWPTIEGDLRGAGLIGDDTLTVVTADHGEAPTYIFDKHRFAHKADMVEGCLRVPLLIRAPGRAHADTDQLASLVDIAPTVLSMLGLSAEGLEPDGVNLFADPNPDRAVFAEGEHFEQAQWDKWGFRRGQERGFTALWERAVISRGLKLVRRGDRALLADLEGKPPAAQVEVIYRAVIGRYPTDREARALTDLLANGSATAHEIAEIAVEAVEEQGEAGRLIATDDLDDAQNLLGDPQHAIEQERLARLLDEYSAGARSMETTDAGYDADDEEAVMKRLKELGYL